MSAGDEPGFWQVIADILVGFVMFLFGALHYRSEERMKTLESNAREDLQKLNDKIDEAKSELIHTSTTQHTELSRQMFELMKMMKEK